MYYVYTIKLDFCIQKIEISTQKINGSYIDTFRIVIVDYPHKKS